MPLDISNEAIEEKNKLNATGVWLVLLEIGYPGSVVRVVNNSESITWPSVDGDVYMAYPFKIGDIKQGESEGLDLTVVDIGRQLIAIVDDHDGALGATATIRIVHSEHLDKTTPEYEEEYEIIDTLVNAQYQIKFKLGVENLMKFRIPNDRYIKDQCRYEKFKGPLCLYSGAETDCDKTLATCRTLENATRYGGCPGVGSEAYNA